MNYNRVNNITGWFIFLVATIAYVITAEPTASYWDCGEFISCAYHLMIPHPPGAPFFLLIGRFFALFASDVEHVAYMVNLVSAFSSSFTTLFLFWTITILAKRITSPLRAPSSGQTLLIMGAGIIGSLAYTFCDSAWFNAVEAEVYAMSSFFTAFVFWAILKWEARAEEISSDRWLILIAYMMGLSIGVHLLNLLTIFAIGFVIYFKKYPITLKGIIFTTAISGAVTLAILIGIIPGLPSLAGSFEIFFVNNLGLPFGSGIIFFTLLVIAALVFGIYYSIKNGKRILNTGLLCLAFILIGYASYGMIVIRSLYEPPIDMNDPDNIVNFVDYLKRKQYGDRPLFIGPTFATASQPVDVKKTAPVYRKGKDKYEVYNYDFEYVYSDKQKMFLPRVYSPQDNHIRAYRRWLNLTRSKPTMGDNIEFLLTYQIGHMYFRYFMWNFAGRKSDIQEDAGWLRPKDWFDTKDLPHVLKVNKARNNFFMLPLILGLAGLIFHFGRNRKDASIVMLLFFFTGIAIVIYLNQPPIEPRERDYTFAGSFWAFGVWIGLGVLALADALQKVIGNETVRAGLATALCLVVPGIMAAEGWDDHDRSNRYHSVDSAKNMLNSCAPNAILFTGGDNDTYPLWYAQQVEGFRTDVRVCNLSLLNTHWYIDQMRKKSLLSQPLPITLPQGEYLDGTNDRIYFQNSSEQPMNLPTMMKMISSGDPTYREESQLGDKVLVFPSKKLKLDINKEALAKSTDVVPEKYKPFILDKMEWTIPGNSLEKKSMIILDILVNNDWKRPVYFASSVDPREYMDLQPYTQLEGLAYRLLPVKVPNAPDGWIDSDTMYNHMMKKFYWRELDNPKAYYNEWYYIFTKQEREMFHRLADQLAREGKKDSAKAVLLHSLKVMPDKSIPFDEPISAYVPLLFDLGEKQKAMEIVNTMGPRLDKNMEYYSQDIATFRDFHFNINTANEFAEVLKQEGNKQEGEKYQKIVDKYLEKYRSQKEALGF